MPVLTSLQNRVVRSMSLRLRLAVLAALAALVVVALFGVGVYVVLSTRLNADVDAALQQYARVVARRLDRPGATGLEALSRSLTGSDPDAFAIAYDASGRELARSPDASGLDLELPEPARQLALSGQGTTQSFHSGGTHYRIYVGPIREVALDYPAGLPTPKIVITGRSIDDVDSTLDTLRLILLGGGGLALLSALGLAWIAAGRGLYPVTQLTRAAESIGTDDLGERLPVPGQRDEITRLSMAFNASLDRLEVVYRELEESLNRQREFVADASHELRTPLTVILNDAQTLIEHPEATPEQRDEILTELLVEAKRMARLSNDLLQLARTGSDGPLELTPVDWDALAADAVHDAARICAPRAVEADSSGPLGAGRADRALVLRAFRVFFDNVARHTPENARVTFRAAASSETVEFAVSDTGPGVAPAVLPRIFDRFFRADRARHGHGTGLGLAIARHVVERHGGTVRAVNVAGGGFRVEVALPRGENGDGVMTAEPARG
jgi:two-component system, OmpR family, sensor kinase